MDAFAAFYLRHEFVFAATQLSLAMLGMGATLTTRDFAEVLRRPRSLIYGLGIQFLIVPLIAWAMMRWLSLDSGVAIGLALCAVVAGGTSSNIFTFLARGNVALSIVLTTLSALLCLVTVPLVLRLLLADQLATEVRMPVGQIASEIGLYLLLPVLLGMAVLRAWPRQAGVLSKLCIRGAVLTIVAIVVGAHSAGRLDTAAFGEHNIRMVLLFMLLLALASALLPRLLRLPGRDAVAINIKVVVRNVNLALLIKASLFPSVAGVADPVGDNALFAALLYGGTSLMAATLLVLIYRLLLRARPGADPVAATATVGG
jgi:BASS family bile acid:Na+ symporter